MHLGVSPKVSDNHKSINEENACERFTRVPVRDAYLTAAGLRLQSRLRRAVVKWTWSALSGPSSCRWEPWAKHGEPGRCPCSSAYRMSAKHHNNSTGHWRLVIFSARSCQTFLCGPGHGMRTVGTDPPWTAQQHRSRRDCLERSHRDITGKSGRPLRRCSTSPTLRVATTSTPRHGYQR